MSRSEKKANRLLQIEALLLAHPEGLTQAEIARKLQVNRSTIGRYIPDLEKVLPNVYIDDLDGNKWKLDRERYLIRVQFNLHEALAVHLASRLLATRMDKQNPHAAAALRKLGISLEELAPHISHHVKESADIVDDATQSQDPRFIQVLEKLALAWAERRKVYVWHRYEKTNTVHKYLFAPYFIEPYAIGQTVHVIGQRDELDALRTFKVERIERIEEVKPADFYDIPESFNPRQLLSEAWGIWYTEEDPQEVVLRFSKDVASRVKETKWHGSEKVKELEDGRILWQAKIAEPQEMLNWIRGWGADVEVISPDSLRESIKVNVKKSAENYHLTPQTKSPTDRLLRLWGKTTADPKFFHPALYHMIDVAHIAYWLLSSHASPRWRNVLAHTLNADSHKLQEWLPYVIALHDVGKISVPFQIQNEAQKKRLEEEGFTFGNYHPMSHAQLHHTIVGHLHLEESEQIKQLPDSFCEAFLNMVAGHHGYYQNAEEYLGRWQSLKEPSEWEQLREHTIILLQKIFLQHIPKDWANPSNISAAIAMLNGFTILCDWLGSDKGYFQPRPVTSLFDYVAHSRQQAYARLHSADFFHPVHSNAPTQFAALFGFAQPRPLQQAIDHIPDHLLIYPTLTIIEAPTGDGKTEAAFALAHRIGRLRHSDELYVALPTTATSNKIFKRLQKFLHNNLKLDHHLIKLVHGQNYAEKELRLAFDGLLDNGDNERPELTWFGPKKQALLAPFAVGTVDQAELTALNVKYNALRLMGLAGKTVILDEVHAYDTYMMTIIERMLAWLAQVGTSVILLSATLPLQKRQSLAQAYAGQRQLPPFPNGEDDYPTLITLNSTEHHIDLPAAHQTNRTIYLHPLHFGDDVLGKAHWLCQQVEHGGCVCWITNLVDNAQEIFAALLKIVPPDVKCTLLHARFPYDERQERENEIEYRYGSQGEKTDRPFKGIVVSTQIVEQSLDLDFDVMVSDLAPIDLLLQRAGRLHRHTDRTNRTKHHPQPHFYVHAVLEADRTVQMGNDRFYGEYLLQKTWQLVDARCNNRQSLNLPRDYRPLIEAVYSSQPDPQFSDAWEQLGKDEAKLNDAAKTRLTPEPDPQRPFCYNPRLTYREDEESNAWIVAQTRYQERPSLTVIPLEKQDDITALLPDGTIIPLNQRADTDTQLKILNRQLRLSQPHIVAKLLKDAEQRPTLFTQSSLLKQCHPLWLSKGKNEELSVELHPELGLRIIKEETNS